MAKIVLDPGHGAFTAGKRCLKSIDKNETREWALNDRIVDKVQEKLAEYENVEILRVDDPTGNKDVSLAQRVKAANDFKADLYCSFHHNAGINGGNGGGLTVITYDNRNTLVDLRNKLYDCLINAGGIKGNRSNPKYANAGLYVLKHTKMNAVLCEHGFMDSTVDTPIILTNEYADKMANGWVNFLVGYFNLKKKVKPIETKPAATPNTTDSSITAGKPVLLINTPVYSNATTTKTSSRKTGTYYVWSVDVTNKRIKITNSVKRVGVKGQITGWVDLADVKLSAGTTTTTTTTTSKPANTATTTPATTPTVSKPAVQYYPKYTGLSVSISDALKSLGIDGSFANRKKIAKANNITGFVGLPSQNSKMLKLLKMGKLIKA